MEDKSFELIEKLYTEMQKGFNNLGAEIKEVRQEVVKTNIYIEQKIEPKLSVLFDGNTQTNDKLDRIENTVNSLVEKVENQELEIKVVRNIKAVK